MLFNSIEFALFALLFFLLWPIFRRKNNSRWIFITIASFIFYGWWDWRFLFLIVFSGLIDFFCGLCLVRFPKIRKPLLVFSLIGNLGTLSVFKYSQFFARVIEDFFFLFNTQIELSSRIPDFALILPVGISFYTFQSLSYTIDIYRGRLYPTKNLFHFFSYLSMFPQLVAGPIVRAKHMLDQLKTSNKVSVEVRWNSIKLICFGLFQKMVIADNLSYFIDSAFEGKSIYDGTLFWWVVMIAFSFQIYCDFCGYSLVAKGLAKYMGFHFRMNFNHPYLALSLKDFWARWHISLSTWFRDYVYFPLGGSRKGVVMLVVSLGTTMLLSGLWHGANYTFIIWALIHTFFLLIERFTKWTQYLHQYYLLLIPIVFVQVLIAWVFFRSKNIYQANDIIVKLFKFEPTNFRFAKLYFDNLLFLILAIIVEIFILFRKKYFWLTLAYNKRNMDVIFVCGCIAGILFFRGEGQQFIYFQF